MLELCESNSVELQINLFIIILFIIILLYYYIITEKYATFNKLYAFICLQRVLKPNVMTVQIISDV